MPQKSDKDLDNETITKDHRPQFTRKKRWRRQTGILAFYIIQSNNESCKRIMKFEPHISRYID